MQREWKQVGEVWVDSGSVMVTDPCYVLPDKRDNDPGLDYMTAVSLDGKNGDKKFEERSKKWREDGDMTALQLPGHEGSFLFDSGFGDGAYPIYALISDEGKWGTRCMGVFIDFDGGLDPAELPTQGYEE